MDLKFFDSKKVFFYSCLLLMTTQLIQSYPMIRYDRYDDSPDAGYEFEMLNKLSEVPVPKRMIVSQPSMGQWVREKKVSLTAGEIAAYLSALARDRNGQVNGDKIKNQRFGISK